MISVFTYLFALIAVTPASINQQAPASGEATTLEWKKKSHDFGEIIQGTKAKYVFTFINKGNSNVLITNAQASCGCTVPNFSKEPIAPGGSGSITVIFDSNGKSGKFTKTINITTSVGTTTLFINGNIIVEQQKPKSPVQLGD